MYTTAQHRKNFVFSYTINDMHMLSAALHAVAYSVILFWKISALMVSCCLNGQVCKCCAHMQVCYALRTTNIEVDATAVKLHERTMHHFL